ncbi:hypothetical protein H1R20_g1432, partial [Candolleomyces eurysporus]
MMETSQKLSMWDADPGWLDNTFIISLLPLLTSLKNVSIHGPHLLYVKWPTLQPAVQIAFHNLFAQPHVVSLTLHRVFDIDIAAFSQYHHLEELTLRNVRLTEGRPSQSGACFPLQTTFQLDHPTGSLRSLSITDSVVFLAEALFVCTASSGATFNFRNLTQLDLRLQEFDKDFPSTCASLIKACGPSLETYKTSFRRGPLNHASVSSALQLRRFPHLASFSLVVDNSSHVGLNGCEIIRSILVPELDLLPGSGSQSFINSIHLNINTLDIGKFGVTDKKDLYGFCSEEVWSRLDEILARPEFPFLRELSILFDVCMEELRRQDLVDVKELVLARMPNLQEKGIVTVSTRETTLGMY